MRGQGPGGSIVLVVAALPARGHAERAERRARRRAAAHAHRALADAAAAAASRLPLFHLDCRMPGVRRRVSAADSAARTAAGAAVAAVAPRAAAAAAWAGYVLPQDLTTAPTGGYGTSTAAIGDCSIFERNNALETPRFEGARAHDPAQHLVDAARVPGGGAAAAGGGAGGGPPPYFYPHAVLAEDHRLAVQGPAITFAICTVF